MDPVAVSVIVPAYNIDEYLAQCLDSLVAQRFTDFECIIVNDGSTDKTKSIAETYTKRDKRFRLVNKPNGGLSSARNAGFDVIRGTCVIFLDGDDFFAPELIGDLYASITQHDTDIAVANYKLYYEGMKKYSEPKIDFSVLNGAETFSLTTQPDHILDTPLFMVWNKLFRVQFLRDHGIRHNEASHRAEDIDFTGRALIEAAAISYVDVPLAFYRTGTDTSNVGTSYKYPYDVLDSLEALKKFIDKKGVYGIVEKSFVAMAVSHILGNLYFTEMHAVHEDVYEKVKKFLLDIRAGSLSEAAFGTPKDYRELQILLTENYIGWLRYRITDLRDNRESQYISYLLSEYQRKYGEEVVQVQKEIETLRTERDGIVNSLSWRITKPLRTLNSVKRRLR